ncbi:hypothetical protein K413DRAFT_1199 [Clostridium sp. ASBs410]|nr:hypothetical protein K413DRAFT_1199 [Clostridium sp. ASBs410]
MCHDMPLVQPPLLFQGGGGERSILGKINSRDKGANGERELANILKEYGYKTHRGQQYCGDTGAADVVGLPQIHIECKRVERLNIYDAIEQAKSNAEAKEIPFGECNLPAVFHRKNKREWLVTMPLNDWITIYREWEAGNALEQE